MKYDDASWHYGGEFPNGLPREAAATHSGMLLAWALLNGLGSADALSVAATGIQALQERQTTPGSFIWDFFEGKLTDQEFSEEGQAFVQCYFNFEASQYLKDYEKTLQRGRPTLYHVPDTWDSYDALSAVLKQRLADWRLRYVPGA